VRFFLTSLVFLSACAFARAQLPQNLATGTIAVRRMAVATTSFGATLDMAIPHGDTERKFIVGKGGAITLLRNNVPAATPYLDIRTGFGLINGSETGLLGMAFHPHFQTASSPGFGKFYTYTSEARSTNVADFFVSSPTGGSHHNVIREWTTDPAADVVANPAASSRVLMRMANSNSNHNGGSIKFGPDGMLYASLGDGGSSGLIAQNLTQIFGKVIRIDPLGTNSTNGRYGTPADNPFAAAGDPGLDEIYAYGLRNPFRMSFDRQEGGLVLGDVGASTVEEVDGIIAGGNYGWPYFEGTTVEISPPPPGFTSIPPLAQYNRSWGASVIGGFVYRGSEIPDLFGKYVFGDAFNGNLRYMDLSGGQIYTLTIGIGSDAGNGALYGWGEDATGELFYMTSTGRVFRLAAPIPEPALSCVAVALLVVTQRARRA
jgi:glucose/arabinose dehydrogenase